MNTFSLLFPVFGIIALGFILRRFNIAKHDWIKKLNSLVYYVSLPALIISLFWKTEFTQSTLGFFGFHAGIVIALSLLLAIFLSLFAVKGKTKVAVILGALVGNTMYMGYPILRATYPDFPIGVSLGAGTVQLVVGLLASVLLIEYLVLKTKKLSTYLSDLAVNPLILAVAAGVVLSFIPHNQFSNSVFNFVSAIGETASPIALFTLGAFLYRRFSTESWFLASFAILFKLAALPLIVLLASTLFGWSREFTQISVLVSAMPTAITSFVLAEKYNLDDQLSADVILISTILSIASIPLVVWLLSRI